MPQIVKTTGNARPFLGGFPALFPVSCLVMWLHGLKTQESRSRFLVVFATLYAGVLFTYGFSALAHRYSSKYFLVTSICETALSACIVIFAKNSERVVPLGGF